MFSNEPLSQVTNQVNLEINSQSQGGIKTQPVLNKNKYKTVTNKTVQPQNSSNTQLNNQNNEFVNEDKTNIKVANNSNQPKEILQVEQTNIQVNPTQITIPKSIEKTTQPQPTKKIETVVKGVKTQIDDPFNDFLGDDMDNLKNKGGKIEFKPSVNLVTQHSAIKMELNKNIEFSIVNEPSSNTIT